jgi:hypothetical protein
MKRKIILLLPILLISLATGCAPSPEELAVQTDTVSTEIAESWTAAPSPSPSVIPDTQPEAVLMEQGKKYMDQRLVTNFIDKSRDDLNLSISFNIPFFENPTTITETDFNNHVQAYIERELEDVIKWVTSPIDDPGGFMIIDFSITTSSKWSVGDNPAIIYYSADPMHAKEAILTSNHDILSILFSNMGYFGGAHPGTSHESLNYDLTDGRKLELGDLFLPGSPYLDIIADYSIRSLRDQEELLFDDYEKNAASEIENYRVWSITRRGLLVIFEEYQVAPYASGPQYVLIPYDEIGFIIKPEGPLGKFKEGL